MSRVKTSRAGWLFGLLAILSLSERMSCLEHQFGGEDPFQRASNFVRRPAAFAETPTLLYPFDWSKGVRGVNIIRKNSYMVFPFNTGRGMKSRPATKVAAPPWPILQAALCGKPRGMFAARYGRKKACNCSPFVLLFFNKMEVAL